MNNHTRRLLLAGLIGVLVLTALFLLLEKTPLVITAYCFSLFAVVEVLGTFFMLANGSKSKYVTNAAFPLVSFGYLKGNLILNAVFVLISICGLWTIPTVWFIFLHILLIAFFAWKLLAMDSAQEEIARVDQNVKVRTSGWKILGADAEELLSRTPAAFHEEVSAVRDAIRYADPMCDPSLEQMDMAIVDRFHDLDDAVTAEKAEEVQKLSAELLRKIKDRNNRVKLLK